MYDLATAIAIVKRQSQAAFDPVVTDQEINDLLTQTARYTTWAASHTYAYGDRVIPLENRRSVYRSAPNDCRKQPRGSRKGFQRVCQQP